MRRTRRPSASTAVLGALLDLSPQSEAEISRATGEPRALVRHVLEVARARGAPLRRVGPHRWCLDIIIIPPAPARGAADLTA